MSEVDRLSNSGLYPALPIADKRRDKDAPAGKGKPSQDPPVSKSVPPDDPADPNLPRPPKSHIDEYA
jgi:hypothetical protein